MLPHKLTRRQHKTTLSLFYELKSCSYLFQKSAPRWTDSSLSPTEITFKSTYCTSCTTKDRRDQQPTSSQTSCPAEERSEGGESLHPGASCGRRTWRARPCAEISGGLLREERDPAPADVSGMGRGLAPRSQRRDVTACFKSLIPVGYLEMFGIYQLRKPLGIIELEVTLEFKIL